MAAIAFPNLSASTKLPNGTTYSYIHVKPSDNNNKKPYILFCHGWPSSSYDWRHQITYFSERGYGLIVPDLLGYGGTDKPLAKEEYRLKKMAGEVVGILDACGVGSVVGVGHDWGSILLSRLYNYHPQRFSKLAFLDVGYQPPSKEAFSVDAINNMTTKMIGYPIFGYWHFFNEDEAGHIMDEHTTSLNTLCYPSDPSVLKTQLAPPNACRAYLTTSQTSPLAPWLTPPEITTHDKIFAKASGGYVPTLNWYKCQISNLNAADDRAIPDEAVEIKVETLFVAAKSDAVAVPVLQEGGMRSFVKGGFEVREVEAGHWVQLEKSGEVNGILEGFFGGKEGD